MKRLSSIISFTLSCILVGSAVSGCSGNSKSYQKPKAVSESSVEEENTTKNSEDAVDDDVEANNPEAIREIDFNNRTWLFPKLDSHAIDFDAEYVPYDVVDGRYAITENDWERMESWQCQDMMPDSLVGENLFITKKAEDSDTPSSYTVGDPIYGDINEDGYTDVIVEWIYDNPCAYRTRQKVWTAWLWDPNKNEPRQVTRPIVFHGFSGCGEETSYVRIERGKILVAKKLQGPYDSCATGPTVPSEDLYVFNSGDNSWSKLPTASPAENVGE
ncbi:hypothetical protein [Arcanobacterium phocae]|uniref:hypothetical protein n=1 Tax=Arcanobacterium phocae TaxID=131112 RepID=UPI001C0EA6EE|nr:hypothetical protein [Arcanobacterium phocae]